MVERCILYLLLHGMRVEVGVAYLHCDTACQLGLRA